MNTLAVSIIFCKLQDIYLYLSLFLFVFVYFVHLEE